MTVINHGSIYLLQPDSQEDREWIAEHINPQAGYWGEAVVVEHRFIGDIVEGLIDAGFEVKEG